MSTASTLGETLAEPFHKALPHVELNLLKILTSRFPGHTILFVEEWSVEEWISLEEGRSIEEVRSDWIDSVMHVSWDPKSPRKDHDSLVTSVSCGHRELVHEGNTFTILKLTWTEYSSHKVTYILIWEGAMEPGRHLIRTVYKLNRSLMWVLDEGWWRPDNELRASVKAASWDDVVLEDSMIQKLKVDALEFFKRRAQYQRLGVAWKRGILFLGEPGNGKSLVIKVRHHVISLPIVWDLILPIRTL